MVQASIQLGTKAAAEIIYQSVPAIVLAICIFTGSVTSSPARSFDDELAEIEEEAFAEEGLGLPSSDLILSRQVRSANPWPRPHPAEPKRKTRVQNAKRFGFRG
ncbi:unnamed protein product [Notodromas monacha]|uniref:Uncharacterized protein n=1 Tax=Notodromas monacha TaxID=399045 RepID=A0A7R9BUS7_9CRUS|nr:unnamed protein product [Notodromas monacha]CAG0921039.1 unnamed protein product [Notodromas monacha]